MFGRGCSGRSGVVVAECRQSSFGFSLPHLNHRKRSLRRTPNEYPNRFLMNCLRG
jgi:hypothetical protein